MVIIYYFCHIKVESGHATDIVEGDIKLTPEQVAIFSDGGWESLLQSEAWNKNVPMWNRVIPFTIADDLGEFVYYGRPGLYLDIARD